MFCYMCGRTISGEPVRLTVVCPNCTVDIVLYLCRNCALKLKNEIEKQIRSEEKNRVDEEKVRRFSIDSICPACGKRFSTIVYRGGRWYAIHFKPRYECDITDFVVKCEELNIRYLYGAYVLGNLELVVYTAERVLGEEKVNEIIYRQLREFEKMDPFLLGRLCEKARELLKEVSSTLGSYGTYSFRIFTQTEKLVSELRDKGVYVSPGDLIQLAILLNIEKFNTPENPENQKFIKPVIPLKKKLLSR